MSKYAFLFPGQGAQFPEMGKDFYDGFPCARETIEEGSDLLGRDLKGLLFKGSPEELSQTEQSQPAIFTVSIALLRVVQQEFPALTPFCTAGLSLGEYTALVAAEKLSFASALPLVASRGRFMQEACQERAGTMRVVLGLEPAAIQSHLTPEVWIANLNCPGQVVIAGAASKMAAVEENLKQAGARRILPLEVSGAFHTPLMQSAQHRLKRYLEAAPLHESRTAVVMNVTGQFAKSVEEIRNNLIEQVVAPTRWQEAVQTVEGAGVELYVEIGPGKTLAGMNKKIGTRAGTVSVEKVNDLKTLEIQYAALNR